MRLRHRTRISDVDLVYHDVSRRTLAIKSTLAGKVAAAVNRQRRAPVVAFDAWRAARRDGPPSRPRERVRAVYLVVCGPRTLDDLSEVIESIHAYDDVGTRILVVDDATGDVRWPHVRARHPEVEVVRARWPTGGPPRLSPPLALGFRTALERFDFDVVCKLDTDALVTGPGLTERAAAAFADDPSLGLLGGVKTRADGQPDDYSYDRWVLEREARWSRRVRERLRRAHAGAYDGSKVHGGVYLISRRALDAMHAAGDLHRDPPWWSQIGEDLWFTLGVAAAGLRAGSWGAPGDPLASASKWLPVPLDEIRSRGVLAAHSVRRGSDGEPESAVRAELRRQRQAYRTER